MASAILKRVNASAMSSLVESMRIRASSRAFAAVAVGTDIVSAAPDAALQKARSWDEGVSSKFSTTPLKDIFKGAYTGVCSQQHVPSYKNKMDEFKAKGIDSVICVS
ncbi:peroxiredoxin-2F, mitochondrial-like, partial [Cucurbita pepo subsp. pepo]|uniref:peroxiredoxin-2F, mitochondrial-like n=1 Tax=Cucurbita pepo subsp. pepo TaxID=3664 RepID=UPI000C9D8DF3